jgi:uncharacterized membrane protein YeaQ/YmgE (transglycosylase-associated protein family)
MGLIMTLILGGIVGWLASIVMKTDARMGLVANVVVGAVLLIFILGKLGIFGKR